MGIFNRFKKNDTTETENSNPAPKLNIFNKIKKKTNNILKKAPSNNFQTNTNDPIDNNPSAATEITIDGNIYSSWEEAYEDLSGNYDSLSTNYSGDIKDAAKQLNTKAKLQNEELIPKFSVKQSKVQYQTEQISSLNYYVFYLIWIYAFLAAFFMINLFISKKTKQISLYVKLLIALLLFLYPYYVTSLQDLLYEIGRYAGNMLYGSVYHSPDY